MFNGGFSLRNVSTMKDMCRAKPWSGEAEDLYFMISTISRPTRDVGRSFSVQDFRCEGIPVGCHQIWLSQDEEYIRNLFKKMK